MPLRRRRFALVTLALLVASCGGGPAPPAAPRPAPLGATGAAAPVVTDATVLPATWELGVPMIETTIDGRGPCRLLLDSGASVLVLAERLADELGLERIDLSASGGVPFDAQGVAAVVRQGVRIREFGVGGRVWRDTGAVVLDMSVVEQIAGTRIDGLLPAAGFRDALLTIDASRRSVTLAAGELPPADGRDVLELGGGSCPSVVMDLGGSPCTLLLDTGDHGFLAVPAGREASLRFRSGPVVVGRHATAAGVFTQRAGRLAATLSLGRHAIADPIVSIAQSEYAIAGWFLLREFRVTFDFANSRVRLERTGAGPLGTPPIRSPGAGFRRAGGAWTVAYVLDAGPAATAGLRVGDRIVAVEGRPASDVGFVEYEEMLGMRNSLRLRVADADGAAARDVTVDVATLVE